MSQLRDHPPVSGAIIWAKQIERQLSTYMQRVEDVLGKGWELYAEGQKLESESTSFRRKLDTRPIYEAWLHDINRKSLTISGRLFDISKNRSSTGASDAFVLTVNFDPQIITLFKEVRNLAWLGFQVPHAMGNTAKDAKRVYPHAVSLMETVRTYTRTLTKIEANPGIAVLVAQFWNLAQQQISRGMSVRWEHFINHYDNGADAAGEGSQHTLFVREFASAVSTLSDRTDTLVDVYAEISQTIAALATCAYDSSAFGPLLASIQKTIDQLNLEGYANLEAWVAELDLQIETVLMTRLRAIIELWCTQFAELGSEPGWNSKNKAAVVTSPVRLLFPCTSPCICRTH